MARAKRATETPPIIEEKPARWEYGGYYLDNPFVKQGSHNWYACRYDGNRKVTRRSLRTTDFEQAKGRLIALAETATSVEGAAPGPDKVLITTVMDAYLTHKGAKIKSEELATHVTKLVLSYLVDKKMINATVATWTPSRQLNFAEWLHKKYDHSPATIQRYLGVMSAAFIDATKVSIREDGMGREAEGSLMSHAPKVTWKESALRKSFNLPAKKPSTFVPSLDEMACFIDALTEEHLKRWALLALSTWARPEAVTDFDPYTQWDRRTNMIDLDKPGRAQTNKRRARIICCQTLAASLEGWMQPRDFPKTEKSEAEHMEKPPILLYQRKRVWLVQNAVRRTSRALDFPGLTQKTTRTFMATMVRKLAPGVPREKRSMWLGHIVQEGSRTTDFYEISDPDYLADVALATDYVLQCLLNRVNDKEFAVETLLNEFELRRIGIQPEDDFRNDINRLTPVAKRLIFPQ